MFRNKGFAITFILFSILIVLLSGFFLYLILGKGRERLVAAAVNQKTADISSQPEETVPTEPSADGLFSEEDTEEHAASESQTFYSDTESADTSEEITEYTEDETDTIEETETETEPETEADYSLRALNGNEPHDYPVIGEEIPEQGTLTVTRAGDQGEGLVFHAKPEFDAWDTEGNVTRYDGSYEIVGKIYILSGDRACLMYHTADGYYVTSSTQYIWFEPVSTTVGRDPEKAGIFGQNDEQNLYAEILSDDGKTVAFSLYDYSYETQVSSPVLTNVIAKYDPDGVAYFEYHNTDGGIHTGTIAFETVGGAGYTKLVDIVFSSPVHFGIGDMTEIVLHN